ncbi:Bardet-Biedl syndrome 9 protein [Trypanosoma cruzi]|uniref:Bardet-Biedl syndrome 9 protein n=2 Tax=Trypanosoma cruzi TaxID=5693 RepID=Q4DNK9_TRYCC|nr:hypothetical protein, conserved [Trypanosoma cruzi]EAN94101.1 hypothetical protein, conserved [Trypanosoma cruzi]PWV18713.1 Bardet-Biedl syndrome 9 protein [Trypanosoma cruzi]|eukprot:XP_815952.1 hypothetical protein [Trypanosoma cruzi strain CL Brener]
MGSLFKLRDHWYSSYRGEEFSHFSALTLGNADNNPDAEDKIIFGSFSGTLRVLRPTKKGAAQPDDTLIEKDFGAPILQVACRPLEPVSGGQPKNLIVILFPKRLVLARLLREGDKEKETENTDDFLSALYRFTIHYEVCLASASYNFTCGNFGRASHEMVCVQSMDGQITVVNHNTVVLQCFLPRSQFLLPGCFLYCSQRDYFLTNNSAMNLMCYSFATLVSNRIKPEVYMETNENGVSKTCGETISPSWTFLLGEDAVGIEVCRHTRGLGAEDADIVVLCHYSLFVLRLSGELRFSKRLDVESLCLTSYLVPNANACNLLIGTVNGSVNVYSDASLDWSAKMAMDAPLCLAVGEFFKTRGMIVSLSTEGTVSVNYLGTDPEEKPIQPLESKETDYVEMERELRQTLHAIKQAGGSEKSSAKENATVEGILRVEWGIPPTEVEDREAAVNVSLILSNTSPTDPVREVKIAVNVAQPIRVDILQHELKKISPNQVEHVSFRFDAQNNKDMIIPSSLEARAVVMYVCKGSLTCTVSATVRLPLTLVARPTPPVKSMNFVIQLNTNKDVAPSLFDLFPDMAYSVDITANMLSIQYVNGEDATVLASKNACRFRFQASTMEALWILAEELHRRLSAYYDFKIQFSLQDPIPLESYYNVIDTHLAVRNEMIEAKEALSRAAQMFCAVQKRLLLLFRERNPTPVGMVDVLLEESYAEIQRCADCVSVAKPRQKQAAAMLSCCSRLILMQLFIKCQETFKNPDMISLLESIFTCAIDEDADVSWEELTDATLGHILQLSKVEGDLTAAHGPVPLKVISDRLKKRISTLFDRMVDGSQIGLF